MELQNGKTSFSEGTFACDNVCCCYNESGRCVYNVARLQVRNGRACYEDLRQAEIEAELDYADGLFY